MLVLSPITPSPTEGDNQYLPLLAPIYMAWKAFISFSLVQHVQLTGVGQSIKFGLPLLARTRVSPGTLTTTGYYAYENQTYTDLPAYGFVDKLSARDVKTDIKLGFSTMIALESGVSFQLDDEICLYTGLFFDYGLNNVRRKRDEALVQYQSGSPANFAYHSVINTDQVSKVNLVSFGLKVRLGFKL